MAGYVITMDSIESLKVCIEQGYYSTNLSEPSGNFWLISHEGTFTDFISMKEGDNIYFFIKRMIYGIGVLVNLVEFDCKLQNYPDATLPTIQDFNNIKQQMVLNDDEAKLNNRVVCFFRAEPNFFQTGVDMDDVLSYRPESFRMLRALWKLSFVKIDDEENKALRDILLKRNESNIGTSNNTFIELNDIHDRVKDVFTTKLKVDAKNIISSCFRKDFLKHEMAIEAGVISSIVNNPSNIFGSWDYVSHQVVASPFKAIDYMDKMDVFGYRYINNYDTVSKYLLIEIKKDSATIEVIDQLMKYVDWINQEYANGDYSMIEAFVVAYEFPKEVIDRKNKICIRNFIKGRRPTIAETWTNVRLIKYRYNEKDNEIVFIELD